ncbi:hypothetical membrane associated protein [Streptococcus pyogenes]|uniref:hypothetical protein n=1 Tax=Streptococcus pyogenes TaxID=1314 RepID=UPI0004EF535A|nr:hypothetical protein [Streptococcus pyogenes]AIL10489.1 hypothetical protein DP15_1402 [Streptococcus pyogenes]ONG54107.1 hypothetical protein BKN22_06140 [Streptococcus pyogenes]SQF11984.1 hypothetical membrane associated protein [Streptococcus pyogenes]HER3002649.1 hypothetical protein [Streptococcus pyogenes]
MKTKSKRFLNLATLCLALLGTTLLVTQPAEAEVILIPRNGNSSRGSKPQVKDDPYQRGRVDGHKAGLEAAKRGDGPTISLDAVPKPYDSDEQKNGLYRSGYTDMYRHGYYEGRHTLDGNEERGNEERGNEERGNEERGNEERGNEERGNEERGNEERGNEGTASNDLSVEESGDFSVIDEVVEVIYQAVSTIWTYLRGLF